MSEIVRCCCRNRNIVAEINGEDVLVQCKSCKELVKVEPDKAHEVERVKKLLDTINSAFSEYIAQIT